MNIDVVILILEIIDFHSKSITKNESQLKMITKCFIQWEII